ncbi:hydroxyacid dehydrogenase [Iocasia frigidifontis]|uniref:Hydroxyacid dehydrogenase n=1 Tax=Iocasia fonsfrigidae TaxID=2682810 RepID=A0A8A7KEC5_9FIRM|nr:2-hydroxyacid dehydrogenase [Iocasia fonsfrigidae]QTL97789.1 hydroxyacid dehydrogenase [Iocasia fonsfrigidae]
MKIVMLESISISEKELRKYRKKLEDAGHQLIVYQDRVEDENLLIERAGDADILIITNLPLSEKVINSCPNLKMISVAFTGVDHIDMKACKANDVLVCNSSGYADQAVAELVFGMIISIMRNIKSCDDVTRSGGTRSGLIGNEIAGKVFGIVGIGSIGLKVAEIAKTLGCKLLGYATHQREEALNLGVEYLSLDELMKKSDIVSLHVPLVESTRNLIDREKLSLMKESAILINTSRGPVVDSKALADVLNNQKIAGAGIDVFEMEPPIPERHPLLNSKNTILTPHAAFATEESFVKRAAIVFDNIEKYLAGSPQNVINLIE